MFHTQGSYKVNKSYPGPIWSAVELCSMGFLDDTLIAFFIYNPFDTHSPFCICLQKNFPQISLYKAFHWFFIMSLLKLSEIPEIKSVYST